MNADTLAKQIETYSNSIVAFAVLQGLAYSYYFGSNQLFNCVVRSAPYLAETIVAMFLLVTVLLLAATAWLGKALAAVADEHRPVVRRIYMGKAVAIALFMLLPTGLTWFYGVQSGSRDLTCREVT